MANKSDQKMQANESSQAANPAEQNPDLKETKAADPNAPTYKPEENEEEGVVETNAGPDAKQGTIADVDLDDVGKAPDGGTAGGEAK